MIDATVKSNLPAFQDATRAYLEDRKVSVRQGLYDQGGRLVRALIKITPPSKKGQGSAAIRLGMFYAVRLLKPQDFRSSVMKDLIRKRNEEALINALEDRRFPIKDIVDFSPSLVERERRRGRVPKTAREKGLATFDMRGYNATKRAKEAKVGEAKGGWAQSLNKLTGKPAAAWIQRHADAGTIEDKADQSSKRGFIRIVNRSAWAGGSHGRRQTEDALKFRSEMIARDQQLREERETRKRFQRILAKVKN
ncbi:MAG: hypothetical protein AAGJ81_08135 [Verrucomicrobiota bacterium]